MKKLILIALCISSLLVGKVYADEEITDFTALAAAPAVGDLFVVVDISDTTDSAEGTTKKITSGYLFTSPALTSPTATAMLPATPNTSDLGSAAAEWDDLFLGDYGQIALGNDQDVLIIHMPDTGIAVQSAIPQIKLDDADGADGYIDVDATDANDATMTFAVDDSGGDAIVYLTIDGVNEKITASKPVDLGANALDCDSNTVTLSTVAGAINAGGATSMEIPNGTDPDIDAAGEIAQDTDGANETGDVSLRGYDGAAQFAFARKLHCIHATLIEPDTLSARDLIPIWSNESGMTFTITKVESWSDDDDVGYTINEYAADNFSSATAVDAITVSTDGTGVFYDTQTTITHAAIEADHVLAIDFDDTDTPDYLKIAICGWFNADVD